jgi:hypothetical protein
MARVHRDGRYRDAALLAILLLTSCGGAPVPEELDESTSSATDRTSTTGSSSTGQGSMPDLGTGSTEPDATSVSTGASSSGEPDDECPAGIDGLQHTGTFIGVENEWWTDKAVEQDECSAVSKELCEDCFSAPTWLLLLQCIKIDAGMEMHEVQLWSSVPEVEPMLDALLDGPSFSLRTEGAPNGLGTRLTARNELDELLLLASVEVWKYPGEQLSAVDFEGWSTPFQTFFLRDEGCSWRTIPIDGGETERRPYAVEFETDEGRTLVFDREKAVVVVDGVEYDFIVDSAAALDVSSCGGDCVDSEASFTAVRR